MSLLPQDADKFATARRFEPRDASAPAANEAPPKRFVLVPFGQIQIDTTPAYLVKGLVPRVGLTVVWGPPKCGKSFFVFDLVMHIALGWSYRERRVRQGPIVYCALEGADGFKARVEAFRREKMAEAGGDVPFHLIASPFGLVADQAALVLAIRQTLGATTPAAVVVDTLNRSLAGSESDDRDMAAYVQAADAIKTAFGCAVIVVHHCGHEGTRPRGHSSLMGAVDAQIAVKRDASDNIVASVEFMKDGPASDEVVSRLESVEVGTDDDGDAITSCVIVPVEGAAATPKKASRPKCSKGASIALVALQKAIAECGVVPPTSNHIPAATRCVTMDQWREYAYRQGVSESDDQSARRKAFQRAHEALVADRYAAMWDPHVWLL